MTEVQYRRVGSEMQFLSRNALLFFHFCFVVGATSSSLSAALCKQLVCVSLVVGGSRVFAVDIRRNVSCLEYLLQLLMRFRKFNVLSEDLQMNALDQRKNQVSSTHFVMTAIDCSHHSIRLLNVMKLTVYKLIWATTAIFCGFFLSSS